MRKRLRPYQEQMKAQVYDAWNQSFKNVLLVLPTGGGKTVTFCSITIDMSVNGPKYPTAIMVHRKELVQQISLTLAEEEITHNIIAPTNVINGIVAAQRRLFKKQFYNYQSPITVVSVDTLNARHKRHESWAKGIKLWITDEAAHVLKNNKWGRACSYFPNAIGLGVTATPQRLDKKGLGSHADGIFDTMVQGPNTRWMLDNGFLCKYKIAIPTSDYRHFLGQASEGSDYSKAVMTQASQRSQIVGDVVKNYQKFADGKQAILFATDVETGHKMEARFKEAGIKAKLLTAETPDKIRLDALIDYKEKKIQVLLNVDLFDEGLDVPGIECVIMARPTMSLSKFLQMIGRGLRPAAGKEFLIIIDHVGNVTNHGLPDSSRFWTLDRTVKRRDKTNFIRICSNVECNAPYDRTLSECPWCNTEAITNYGGSRTLRPGPKEVDGDLELLDADTLRQLEKSSQLEDPVSIGKRVSAAVSAAAGIRAMKNQAERIKTQSELVKVIANWAGKLRDEGYSDRRIHKEFYLRHDMTITQALGEPREGMQRRIDDITGELEWGSQRIRKVQK